MAKRAGTMLMLLVGVALAAGPRGGQRPAAPSPAAQPVVTEPAGSCSAEAPAPKRRPQPWEEGCSEGPPTLARQ
jgi:hypothetical protein